MAALPPCSTDTVDETSKLLSVETFEPRPRRVLIGDLDVCRALKLLQQRPRLGRKGAIREGGDKLVQLGRSIRLAATLQQQINKLQARLRHDRTQPDRLPQRRLSPVILAGSNIK